MNSFTAWVRDAGGAVVVAKLLECSEVSVYKYMNGERRPRPEMAGRIETASAGRIPRGSWYWPSEAE